MFSVELSQSYVVDLIAVYSFSEISFSPNKKWENLLCVDLELPLKTSNWKKWDTELGMLTLYKKEEEWQKLIFRISTKNISRRTHSSWGTGVGEGLFTIYPFVHLNFALSDCTDITYSKNKLKNFWREKKKIMKARTSPEKFPRNGKIWDRGGKWPWFRLYKVKEEMCSRKSEQYRTKKVNTKQSKEKMSSKSSYTWQAVRDAILIYLLFHCSGN